MSRIIKPPSLDRFGLHSIIGLLLSVRHVNEHQRTSTNTNERQLLPFAVVRSRSLSVVVVRCRTAAPLPDFPLDHPPVAGVEFSYEKSINSRATRRQQEFRLAFGVWSRGRGSVRVAIPGVLGDHGVIPGEAFPQLFVFRLMNKDLLLAIDVGTGSVRAALITGTGKILAFAAKEHDQIARQFGWCQQSPRTWWDGAVFSIQSVLERVPEGADRIAGIAACGQMHGTVLIDDSGELTLDEALLWSDKRTRELVDRFSREYDTQALFPVTANHPTVAWPAFKLAWIKENQPEAYAAARTVLMPKDYINFKLTGERRIDFCEASSSYMFDVQAASWSKRILDLLDLDPAKLPALGRAFEILGSVTNEAAKVTGLRPGTPVAVGAGDFPVALLGAGVIRPELGCDITGTSTLITLLTGRPAVDPIVSNIEAIVGGWATFTIVDAGGDAMRWARGTLNQQQPSGYDQIVALAASVPPGAEQLLFLPYLTGERLARKPNSRAQFFGLTAGHRAAHLHRAVMEGVAFAARRNLSLMESCGYRFDRMVAAAGGAKTRLWVEIKASIYNRPMLIPAEPESGVLGCAMLAGLAVGLFSSLEAVVSDLVRYEEEVLPNVAWLERYQKMQSLFDDLYESSEQFWDRLEGSIPS
jgi:xylulokinase